LNCYWDTVATAIVSILGSIVDDGCQEEASGQSQLIAKMYQIMSKLHLNLRPYVEINVPLIHFGADSDWYKGMSTETTPGRQIA